MKQVLTIFFSCFWQMLSAQNYIAEWKQRKIKVLPKAPTQAYFIPLQHVQLTDTLFASAQQLNKNYLLSLRPDRFLHRFHQNAGLPVKDSLYGGWESRSVSGFNLGHYLSACALLYANTRDSSIKQRVDYTVNELVRCQRARGTGYVGGIPNEDSVFAQIAKGVVHANGADLNGTWVPWYVVHKLMAGLADSYLYANNEQAKNVLLGLADWCCETVKGLSEVQQTKMLTVEFGGMPDILIHCFELTNNDKYLRAAEKFYDKKVLEPLKMRRNELAGIHANTQFPKVLAQSRAYSLKSDKADSTIAQFFWQEVVHHHSYVIGGNSNHENFSKPNVLNNELSEKTTETCNTYNMLKLTKQLWSRNPDAAYFDYYERGLFNHIMASHNNETGMFCYYAPLKTSTVKNWSRAFDDFWCCVGTGMESHSKHAEQVYAMGADGSLYVNLYIASTLKYKQFDITLNDKAGNKTITINKAGNYAIKLRVPWYVIAKGSSIEVNGKEQYLVKEKSSYVTVARKWKKGDLVSILFVEDMIIETMPDNKNRVAFVAGNTVYALPLPNYVNKQFLILDDSGDVTVHYVHSGNKLNVNTNYTQLNLIPYRAIKNERLQVYFDVYTPTQYLAIKDSIAKEAERTKALDAITIDEVRIGEQQPEIEHNFKGQHSMTGSGRDDTRWRIATRGGWFSYEVRLSPAVRNYNLLVTYWGGDEGNREFDILVDDSVLHTMILQRNKPDMFFEESYEIPEAYLAGKQKITIKFSAKEGKVAGGIYGLRLLRKNG